jgi:acetyl esterase/lipase
MPPSKRTCTYKSVGGCELRADVFAPAAKPRAVIVWLHGGALIMGSRTNLPHDERDRYLDARYAVVSVDYRLAPETKLPQIIDDLRDAFAWVRTTLPGLLQAQTARLAAVGHSAGGYLALMSGLCVQPPPAALVSFYGYGDIVGPWYSRPDPCYCQQPLVPEEDARRGVGRRCVTETPVDGVSDEDRGRFYLYCRQHGLWPKEVAGRHPDAEAEFFMPYCPVRNVTPDYPPTLLLHGDQDTDVPYEQSVMMTQALRAGGVEHQLVTIRGGGHGFDRACRPEVTASWATVMTFLAEHLSSGTAAMGTAGQ